MNIDDLEIGEEGLIDTENICIFDKVSCEYNNGNNKCSLDKIRVARLMRIDQCNSYSEDVGI